MKKFLSLILLMGILISMMGTASVALAAEEAASDVVYETIFEDDFSVDRWSINTGTKSYSDGVLNVVGTETAYVDFFPQGVALKAGTQYRISYRTKVNASYFLIYKFNTSGNTVQTSVGGAYAGEFYDHTVEGGRGGASNSTTDWQDVSYTITIHDIKNSSGVSVNRGKIDRLRFQVNGNHDFSIENLKIEEVKTKNNYLSKTIFEDDFSSQGKWAVNGGSISVEDGVLKVTNTANTNLEIYPESVNFKSGSRYRVTYRTKAENKSYFLIYKFNSSNVSGYNVIDRADGTYTGELYDHAMYEGRISPKNTSNGAYTSDWVDVSYEFTVHGIKDLATGNLVDSAPVYCLRYMLQDSPEFYFDHIKIEEIVTDSFEEKFDETALSDWSYTGGTLTSEDDAFVFDSSNGKFCYKGSDLKLYNHSKYRVSYTSKTSIAGSYYMALEIGRVGQMKLQRDGAYTTAIYDNSGYRPGSWNYTDQGAPSTDWCNISYEFSVHDLIDTNGNSVESLTVPAEKLFFAVPTEMTFSVKNLKIERIPMDMTGDVYYNPIVYEDFSDTSLSKWTINGGSFTSANGVASVTASRLQYKNADIKILDNTLYRISYRAKLGTASSGFNFLAVELTNASATWKLSPTGAHQGYLYDNGYHANPSTQWTDISYILPVYDLADTSGNSVASVNIPAEKLFFMFSGTVDFDHFVIEEIVNNVGFSYDESKGTVYYQDEEVKNGQRVTSANGNIAVTPKDGYYLKEIVVTDKNGAVQSYPSAGAFVFDENTSVSVVFGEYSSQISKSSASAYQEENGVLVYAGINAGGKAVSEYGIDLTNGTDSFRLKADSTIGLSDKNEFGIRAFGSWFVPGDYQVKAYAVIDGTEVTESWTDITVEE